MLNVKYRIIKLIKRKNIKPNIKNFLNQIKSLKNLKNVHKFLYWRYKKKIFINKNFFKIQFLIKKNEKNINYFLNPSCTKIVKNYTNKYKIKLNILKKEEEKKKAIKKINNFVNNIKFKILIKKKFKIEYLNYVIQNNTYDLLKSKKVDKFEYDKFTFLNKSFKSLILKLKLKKIKIIIKRRRLFKIINEFRIKQKKINLLKLLFIKNLITNLLKFKFFLNFTKYGINSKIKKLKQIDNFQLIKNYKLSKKQWFDFFSNEIIIKFLYFFEKNKLMKRRFINFKNDFDEKEKKRFKLFSDIQSIKFLIKIIKILEMRIKKLEDFILIKKKLALLNVDQNIKDFEILNLKNYMESINALKKKNLFKIKSLSLCELNLIEKPLKKWYSDIKKTNKSNINFLDKNELKELQEFLNCKLRNKDDFFKINIITSLFYKEIKNIENEHNFNKLGDEKIKHYLNSNKFKSYFKLEFLLVNTSNRLLNLNINSKSLNNDNFWNIGNIFLYNSIHNINNTYFGESKINIFYTNSLFNLNAFLNKINFKFTNLINNNILINLLKKKVFKYIYSYFNIFKIIYLNVFFFKKKIKFFKPMYYLIFKFKKNKLFINFKNSSKKTNYNFFFLSSGLFIKFFEKKKSMKKNKIIKLLMAKYLKKIFYLTKISQLVLIIKKTPVLFLEFMNTLNQPIAHELKKLNNNDELVSIDNFNIKILYYIFKENKSYVINKLRKKGRVKRKILRKLVLSNKLID